MKKFLKITLILVLIFLVIWGSSLIKCEYLTYKHGHEFDFSPVSENTMLSSEPDWFRIISYNDEYTEIYYISENFKMGNILRFKKVDGNWIYDDWWRVLWTLLGGNADENVWPYFWHREKYRNR